MKKITFLLFGLASFLTHSAFGGPSPCGNLLELHSCELYAGGCTVSSEATLGGRYMLRAWQFTGGSFVDVDLTGLKVALLQASSENLAAPKADPGQAVVYLPADATSRQSDALLAWLKATQPGLKLANLKSRTAPLEFEKTINGYWFSAGNLIDVRTASLESCETRACGEALWYTPRSQTSVFTVAVDRASRVIEPLLQLKWSDAGKRNVFLGRFGDPSVVKSQFVAMSELCGPSARLLE